MLWRAGGEKLNMNLIWTAASLVLTRCFQVRCVLCSLLLFFLWGVVWCVCLRARFVFCAREREDSGQIAAALDNNPHTHTHTLHTRHTPRTTHHTHTQQQQVYTNAQNQKMAMSQKISAALYDKMQDSQEGVVSVIMEVCVLCAVFGVGGGRWR